MAAAIALGAYIEEGPRRKTIRTEALGAFLDNNAEHNYLQIGISDEYRRKTQALFVTNERLCKEIHRLKGVITYMREASEAEGEEYVAQWNAYLEEVENDPSAWRPTGPHRCRECGQ